MSNDPDQIIETCLDCDGDGYWLEEGDDGNLNEIDCPECWGSGEVEV